MTDYKLLKPYKKEYTYSYTSGAYATMELIKSRPKILKQVFVHPAYTGSEDFLSICSRLNVPAEYGDRPFQRINQKENSYILGLFEKYNCELNPFSPHIVLVNPSDMGNLGTIIRTAAGMNIPDLAVITPAADIFHPKTVRASMGALFRSRFELFQSFEDYRAKYTHHSIYPFMLDANHTPADAVPAENGLFSMVFGSEASGLGGEFKSVGQPVRIPQSGDVDSFNLSVAVGVGAYVFASLYGLI